MLNKLLNLPNVSDQQGLQGEELDNFKEKCNKAEKTFENGGIYICPVCDGESQMCDDDYQSILDLLEALGYVIKHVDEQGDEHAN
mgnify:CR=1 FL=1